MKEWISERKREREREREKNEMGRQNTLKEREGNENKNVLEREV